MYNIKFDKIDNGKCGLEVECTSRDARDAMLFIQKILNALNGKGDGE